MSPRDLVLTPRGLRFAGRLWPCSIGRGGVTGQKREGDGATPRGTHRVVGMAYRPDRIPRPAHWARPIGARDLWCDDPGHPAYNRPVRAPFDASHETLRRADPLYDLVLIVDWNLTAPVPGGGSAIFIHQWRRPGYPTEGCIALERTDLHEIAGRIRPGARLIVP
ncbi:L,D-transpeptidase [Tropicimonas sp. IMCC34011]|uniref:L,D-transpeptidase family protein n=1 Tax=Tropicimonas sp. IMCC34011 TaxID=2248759 RepID=UPI000E22BDCF|nr:L,D-transpeptidase family protein [Tropicimonas sp. IMCC34011]